jgi:hypothetical protein
VQAQYFNRLLGSAFEHDGVLLRLKDVACRMYPCRVIESAHRNGTPYRHVKYGGIEVNTAIRIRFSSQEGGDRTAEQPGVEIMGHGCGPAQFKNNGLGKFLVLKARLVERDSEDAYRLLLAGQGRYKHSAEENCRQTDVR